MVAVVAVVADVVVVVVVVRSGGGRGGGVLGGCELVMEVVPIEAAGVPPEVPHAASAVALSAATASSRSDPFHAAVFGH